MKNVLSEFNKILSKIKTRDYEIGSFLSNVFTIDDTQLTSHWGESRFHKSGKPNYWLL